jgi:hypothetical protein
MKNEQLYNKTVDILVQAYFNDTLEHGNCYACAVGNIIAANKGYTYVPCIDTTMQKIVWDVTKGSYGNPNYGSWYDAVTYEIDKHQNNHECNSTGYSIYDLRDIEKAFEKCYKGITEQDYIFNGLMAVIDVLDKIHENTDTAVTSSSKQRFSSIPL